MSTFDSGAAVARTAWSAFLSLGSAHYATMCIMFYKRRKLRPISAQRFPWAFACLISLWVQMFQPAIRYIWFDEPCMLYIVHSYAYYVALDCYLVRGWILWFKFNLMEQREAHSAHLFEHSRSNSSNSILKQEWFVRNTKYASDGFLLKVFFCMNLFHLIPTAVSPISTPSLITWRFSVTPHDYSCGGTSEDSVAYALTVVHLFAAVMIIFAAVKFRAVEDGFFLKRELLYAGVFYGGWSLVEFVSRLVLPDPASSPDAFPWVGFIRELTTITLQTILSSVTGWYPIFKSYSMEQGIEPTRNTADGSILSVSELQGGELRQYETMQAVLASRSGRAAFRRHLKLEFSLENMLFWEAVETFRREYETSKGMRNLELARKVVDEFITPDAVSQVNIAWPTAERILASVALDFGYDDDGSFTKEYRAESLALEEAALNVQPSLFDEAQQKVVSLMACDSFVRFKNERRRASVSMQRGPGGSDTASAPANNVIQLEPVLEVDSLGRADRATLDEMPSLSDESFSDADKGDSHVRPWSVSDGERVSAHGGGDDGGGLSELDSSTVAHRFDPSSIDDEVGVSGNSGDD